MPFSPPVIRFEDEDFVAVSKPVGLVVDAGGEGPDADHDLVSLLTREWGHRVFAFHRLDRDTSGLVLLGRRKVWAAAMTQAFEEKRVRKSYLAVVEGLWPKSITKIEEKVGDREAKTTFRGLVSREEASLIEALPKTGRKHQIRQHCAYAKHPVCGDALYGSRHQEFSGHALHAYRLEFTHPRSHERIAIADRPDDWRSTWLKGLGADEVWEKLKS